MVSRRVIPPGALLMLDPHASPTPEQLRGWLLTAFGAGKRLPEMPPELVRDGAVTRGGLALWLWAALGSPDEAVSAP